MRKNDFIDSIQSKNPKFTIRNYRELANKVGINPSEKDLTDEQVDLLTRALAGEDVAATPRGAGSSAIAVSRQEAMQDIGSLAVASKQGAERQIDQLRVMRDLKAGELAEIALEVVSPESFDISFTQQFAQKARERKQEILSGAIQNALPPVDLSEIWDVDAEMIE